MIITKNKSSKLVIESGTMFIAEGIGLAFAMMIVLFRGRYLSEEDVGLISYITTLISFFSGFFNLGLDNTGARVVLRESEEIKKKRVAGMVILLAIILCGVFSVVMVGMNALLPIFGNLQVIPYVYMILPFAGYNILLLTYKQLCFGLGAIKQASFQLYISYVVYFVILIILQMTGRLSLATANFYNFSVNMLTVLLPVLYIYKKNVCWDNSIWKKIKTEQKERGWKIYFSRVVFISSSHVDILILGYFYSMDSVAFYAYAKYFSMPVMIIGSSVSQSLYRKFGVVNYIEKKMLRITILATALTAGLMYLVSVIAVYIMGDVYKSMLSLMPLALLSSGISGINAIYNSFLNAKGLANELLNLSIVGAIGQIVFNFSLIIIFGAIGGIWAQLIVITMVFSMRVFYCNRYKKMNGSV